MYNEEQKTTFIRQYTGSLSMAEAATQTFNAMEKYELQWGADFCTKRAEDLQPVVDELCGLSYGSKWLRLSIMREYVKWCLGTGVPGACDGMLQVNSVGLEKIKRQMVSGPRHLQKVLDEIFEPDEEQATTATYRCYFWLAFGGLLAEEAVEVRAKDVDFSSMTVHAKGRSAPIYREGLQTFHNVVELDSLRYYHPNYLEPIWRPRVPGDKILRGVKADFDTERASFYIARYTKSAFDAGQTTQRINYHNVWRSGIFYRVCENERAGIPIDFSEYMTSRLDWRKARNREFSGNEKVWNNSTKANLMRDYYRWKLAFNM